MPEEGVFKGPGHHPREAQALEGPGTTKKKRANHRARHRLTDTLSSKL